MIAPSNRSLLWTALIILPCSALITAIPQSAVFSGTIILGLMIIVSVDVLISRNKLQDHQIILPEIIRIVKGCEQQIPVEIRRQSMQYMNLRFAFILPESLYSSQPYLTVIMPAEHQVVLVHWYITGEQRGEYHLSRCYLETLSRLGFWSIRASVVMHSRLRVYPDLRQERKYLAALFLRRGFGVHHQRQIGKGRDFEQLREYLPGDSFEDIHWKATARYRRPITKIYQVERTQELYTLIDTSRLSVRMANTGSAGVQESYLDRFITASLALGIAAERQGDLFGVLPYAEKVQGFVRAGGGKAHFRSCRDLLNSLTANTVTPDYDELYSFIGLRLQRRSLLIMLTSLDDQVIAESLTRHISLIARKHLVLIGIIVPPGTGPIFETGPVTELNDLYVKLGGHLIHAGLRETQRRLHHSGATLLMLSSEKLCADMVSYYVRIKQRQIL